MSSNQNQSQSQRQSEAASEVQPLLQPMSKGSVGRVCFGAVVAGLVLAWCVLDTWNRSASSQLFEVGEVQKMQVDKKTGNLTPLVDRFRFPLTLAFIQFAFMAGLFTLLWWLFAKSSTADLSCVKDALTSSYWPILVVSHVFSTFWLQALMMPTQMMSLGLFAASRAVEIPAAAGFRSAALGVKFGGHTLATSVLMFAAAWTIFYSYTQIAECLCIWSGHGVALAGTPLYVIYMLVLTVPAANTVYQEAVIVKLEVHPLLMLGLQNLFACILFAPILLAAHLCGGEDVLLAMQMITTFREVYMLTVWLCIQMAALSAVTVALVCVTDSFWAVAMKSMRVVYWWVQELLLFYFLSDTLLSIARPRASLWGFVMLCGTSLAASALCADRKEEDGEGQGHVAVKQSLLWKAV